MAKALNERDQAQTVLNDLALEIPSLQQTISALQYHLHPHTVDISPKAMEILTRSFNTPPLENLITIDEDELLPDPEGTPLLPED